ncbi:MAG: hypothetical protein DRN90_06820 [Thermoproteota archaeon]|nr:MAG: hypothetical protein DRN90_06820 [Candidatus Korarchaeota archaeon]RLG73239.1 MAG: hypothetical protein DRO11_00210 [Euryarchaeota archaeon]
MYENVGVPLLGALVEAGVDSSLLKTIGLYSLVFLLTATIGYMILDLLKKAIYGKKSPKVKQGLGFFGAAIVLASGILGAVFVGPAVVAYFVEPQATGPTSEISGPTDILIKDLLGNNISSGIFVILGTEEGDPYDLADKYYKGELEDYEYYSISSGKVTIDDISPGTYNALLLPSSAGSGGIIPVIKTFTVYEEWVGAGNNKLRGSTIKVPLAVDSKFMSGSDQVYNYTLTGTTFKQTFWVHCNLSSNDKSKETGPMALYIDIDETKATIEEIKANGNEVDLAKLGLLGSTDVRVRNRPSSAYDYFGEISAEGISGSDWEDNKVELYLEITFTADTTITMKIVHLWESRYYDFQGAQFQIIRNASATQTGFNTPGS